MNAFEAGGLGSVSGEAREAAEALEALKGPAQEAAGVIGEAFERAGKSLSGSLVKAAADGKITMAELASMVLGVINAAAGQGGGGGLSAAISGVMSSFSGTRAEGGPVLGGGAYLVGERGPEVFRPTGSGSVEPMRGGGGVTVNMTVSGGPEALLRSEAQIARMLARATALGARGV